MSAALDSQHAAALSQVRKHIPFSFSLVKTWGLLDGLDFHYQSSLVSLAEQSNPIILS